MRSETAWDTHFSDLAGNEGSSRLAPSHLPGQEQTKAGVMPGKDGFGFDDGQR